MFANELNILNVLLEIYVCDKVNASSVLSMRCQMVAKLMIALKVKKSETC